MVFKKGGRYARNEKLKFGNQNVEIVKEYSYLGFKITSNINFERHIQSRVGEGKAALAVTWKKLMLDVNINSEIKHNIFQSTSLATAMYADACWGV